jgi:uncharacterized protein (DUF362 family)
MVMDEDRITRREFVLAAAKLGLAAALTQLGLLWPARSAVAAQPLLAVAENGEPKDLLARALAGVGGIGKYVKKGATVAIKPNGGWARAPQYAATTNPALLATLIRACQSAGAREVKVVEHTCDTPASLCIEQNQIKKATEDAGGKLILLTSKGQYREVSIPKGKLLKHDLVSADLLDADVFINLPIAKVHSQTRVTCALKNLMGVNLDRQAWHDSRDLDQCIADFATKIRPALVIVDAIRILLTNGPKGPGRTKDLNMVYATTDPVAADAYASTLLGLKPSQIPHLVKAAAAGLGSHDLAKVTVKKV